MTETINALEGRVIKRIDLVQNLSHSTCSIFRIFYTCFSNIGNVFGGFEDIC